MTILQLLADVKLVDDFLTQHGVPPALIWEFAGKIVEDVRGGKGWQAVAADLLALFRNVQVAGA